MARRFRIPDDPEPSTASAGDAPCPLCGRPLGSENIDRHHLIPKSLKGREQFAIHKVCHRKIHATLSEKELLRAYHTWEALQGHEDIRSFIAWVANKPPAFYTRTFTSNKKKRR
ncbi:HNH endonuclease [Massilia sp. Bi118]|uniref:HNH endonuclease n=1 Tax=Massilia sp. Bi118 TaxID=2822346 RepID=UPI001E2AD82D|nr:HNH endonuclease signature motif containing protein [Massilia sp. Bi118]